MRAIGWLFAGSLLSVQLAGVTPAAEKYRGAESLLQYLAAREAERAAPRKPRAAGLQAELRAFRAESARLDPARAAERWLELADRYLGLSPLETQPDGTSDEPLDFGFVMRSLPAPACWNELSGRILTRMPQGPPKSLRHWTWQYLRHVLQGDRSGLFDDLEQLHQLKRQLPAEEEPVALNALLSLCDELLDFEPDPARILRILEMKVEHQPGSPWGTTLSLPDLVALIGDAKAEVFLRRVMTTTSLELEAPEGGATLKLAQRVALAEIRRLKRPQWGLVSSLDSIPLYQAMERRFAGSRAATPAPVLVPGGAPDGEGAETTHAAARMCYAFALAAARKPAPGAALLPGLRGVLNSATVVEWGDRLRRTGREPELLELLRLALAQSPDLPLWDYYVPLALRHGRGPEVINRTQALLAKGALSPSLALKLRLLRADVLLATDRSEAAAAELRRAMAMNLPEGENVLEKPFDAAIRLVRIGQALGKQDWVSDGLRYASEAVAESSGMDLRIDGLIQLYDELGRWGQAEQVLFEVIARDSAQEADSPLTASQLPDRLAELAGVYHMAGRPADVLRLLEGAAGWGARDLREVLLTVDYRDQCLGWMVAGALEAAGRVPEAVLILEEVLRERADYDPAYELLTRLQGEKCLPYLDRLAQAHRTEKRPRLWKAQVLLRAGRLEDAEREARAGIALDPTDAEQLMGRRMRGFSILADIREARGDREQAREYRDRVRAARLSEEADRLDFTGLRRLALERDRQALAASDRVAHVQAAAARRLARSGRAAEAEVHYRKACELWCDEVGGRSDLILHPDDAGDWRRGVAIAEEVFQRRAAEQPDRAQPHQCLAALRMADGRPAEALRHHWKVVERDPDHLAGWTSLQVSGAMVTMPAADRETAAREILRLDPLCRTTAPETAAFFDLRALWTAVERAVPGQISERVTPLYPLAASAAALKLETERFPERAAQRKQMEQGFLWRSRTTRMDFYSAEGATPGGLLVAHGLLSLAVALVDAARAAHAPQ